MSTEEIIDRFQTKIYAQLLRTSGGGHNAKRILAIAQDRTHPDHLDCIRACKAAAQSIGKGWPRQWPTDRKINHGP